MNQSRIDRQTVADRERIAVCHSRLTSTMNDVDQTNGLPPRWLSTVQHAPHRNARRIDRARRLLAIGLASLWIAGCDRSGKAPFDGGAIERPSSTTDSASPPVTFDDVTTASGVESTYDNGEAAGIRSIVESLGGGLGICDFDADGHADLFFPGGGRFVVDQPLPGLPNTLWRNLGAMKFASVADAAKAAEAAHYTHGCAMADYDADGFPDILVTGYGGLQLYHNQGDGSFQEVAIESGMTDDQWSTSAAWGDFDNDGNVDVFITHYVDWSWSKNPRCAAPAGQAGGEVCSPQDFKPLLDMIYFSNGDGTFRGVAEQCGIAEAGKGLGVVAVDVDNNNGLDVYVANDTTNNLLFMNDTQGQFRESGVISGTALDQRGVSNGSMGLAVLDYNNDLRSDIWVTNYENETFALYHNDADGMFRCVTESTGITSIGTLYVGFGTVAADFSRSGFEDLVVSNGHVMLYPTYSTIQQNALYLRNNGRGKLDQVQFPPDSYFASKRRGRGVVTGDLDGDGKLDLAFSHVNQPAAILKQTTALDGDWVAIRLIGTAANRDAIGARVTLETESQTMLRTVIGGGSYLSQNPYDVWFGVPGGDTVKGATIQWPDGSVQRLDQVSVNAWNRVVQQK
jgi:hypothetical protein